ncbi:MAG: DUF2911 domain-containing protein [Sphingobacteriales bacterium]|nr:DUF2911 domain-containing protein [Sphingobacteriales bacterium]
MKKERLIITGILILFVVFNAHAQAAKSKRLSPPAKVTETTNSGITISVAYSQPAINGRTIGKEIAPYGEVWRTGANEATVFEINKDVKINGKTLPAGKYGLYSIPGKDKWTFMFNKVWKQWGTSYNEKEDALRVDTKPMFSKEFIERMTFKISKKGEVNLLWGNVKLGFKVE